MQEVLHFGKAIRSLVFSSLLKVRAMSGKERLPGQELVFVSQIEPHWLLPVSPRLVQPSVHQLHLATPHLLLLAPDLLPCHPDGHAVLGVLLD